MRKYIFIILCGCLLVIFASCQWAQNKMVNEDGIVYDSAQLTDANHFEFNGVQMNGSGDQFLSQLQQEAGLTSDTNAYGFAVRHIRYLDVDFELQINESSETHTVSHVMLTAPATNKAEAIKLYRQLRKRLRHKYGQPILIDEDYSHTAVEMSMYPVRRIFATDEGSEILFITAVNLGGPVTQPQISREEDLPIYQVGIRIEDATNAMQSRQAQKAKDCPTEWSEAADGPHMTFLGIPIQGPKSEFMQQLRKRGLITQVTPEPDEYSATFGSKQPYDQVEFCGIKFRMNPVVDGTPDSLVTSVYMSTQNITDSVEALKIYDDLNSKLQQQYGRPKAFSEDSGLDAYSYVTTSGQVKVRFSKGKNTSLSVINGNVTKKEFQLFTIYVEVIDAQGHMKTHRY